MQVQAAPGLKVPMEGKPRDYIVDDTPIEVPADSSYYQRRVAEGDLLVIVDIVKKTKGAD